jgi:ubiquinone/menaquinone biosynthesis C-methylase UbiE
MTMATHRRTPAASIRVGIEAVREFWDVNVCGSTSASAPRYTREYYEQIEQYRYEAEPEIFSFAQFTRYYGKMLLEVGVGSGTDFLQWVRAGARAYGVDLTPEAIEHVRHRLAIYNLRAEETRTASCESLPYDEATFDIVYGWGVLHHTPNTQKAIEEIVRVTRLGGTCRLMLYHRRSLVALYVWIKFALLRLRPWKSVRQCFYDDVESPGTKAFTAPEVRRLLRQLPVHNIRIQFILTQQDKLMAHNAICRFIGGALAVLLGSRGGFYMTVAFDKLPASRS